MSHIVDFHMLPTYYMQECSWLCCSRLSCLSILILHVYWMFWSFPGTWPLAWMQWDVHLSGLHLRRLRLFDLLPVAGCQDGSSGFSLTCPGTSMVHRVLTLLRCGVHTGVGFNWWQNWWCTACRAYFYAANVIGSSNALLSTVYVILYGYYKIS